MAADVKMQQAVALQSVDTYRVARDESVDIHDIPRSAIIARYCSDDDVQEELCCLSPMYGPTKGADILEKFINHFEKIHIDVKKIFAVTTDVPLPWLDVTVVLLHLLKRKLAIQS